MVINRYILKMWAAPFLGSLLAVTAILLLSRALKVLSVLADKGVVDWGIMGTLLFSVLPYFLMLTLPISFFFASMRLFVHLQQSSELDALRASGISYVQLMKPVFVMAILMLLVLLLTAFEWMPRGQQAFQSLLVAVQKSKPAPGFEPQRFTADLEGFTVYIDGKDEQGVMHGMMLEDKRSTISVIYLAESAEISRQDSRLNLVLHHGTRMEGGGDFLRSLAFDEYIVSMDLDALGLFNMPEWRNRVFEMATQELFAAMKADRQDAYIELHWRLVMVFGLFTLLLFVLPLSLTPKRSGATGAYLFGIATMMAMYNMQISLHQQVVSGQLALYWMWFGQLFFTAVGAVFMWKASQDKLPYLVGWLDAMLDRLKKMMFAREALIHS